MAGCRLSNVSALCHLISPRIERSLNVFNPLREETENIAVSLDYVLHKFNFKKKKKRGKGKKDRNIGKPPSIPRLNVYKSEREFGCEL